MRHPLLLLFPVIILLAACGGGQAVVEDPRISEGRALYDRSEFDNAERYFRLLRRQAADENDPLLEAQAEKWLGNVQLAYDQSDVALTHYRRSLSLLEEGISRGDSMGHTADRIWFDERQNVLSNVGVVYKTARRFEDAKQLFRGVFAYDSARGDAMQIAISLYNLGDVYHQHAVERLDGNDSTTASVLMQQSRTLFHRSLDRHPTADAWLNLGNSYTLDAKLDSSVFCYRRAEEMYERAGYRVHRALALGNIGVLERRLGRIGPSVDALERSIAIIEELRGDLSSVDVRSSFVSSKFFIYETLIAILVENGDVVRAFEFVERAKARSFLDMLGNKSIGEEKDRPPQVRLLVAQEEQLQRRISAIVGNTDSSAVLGRLISEHQRVLGALRDADPEYASLKSIDPLPVRDLQLMLDDSTAVLEYFIGDYQSYVFLVRRDTVLVMPLEFDEDTFIDEQIERLRRKLFYDFPMRKLGFLREQRLGKGAGSEEALRAWSAEVMDMEWQLELLTIYSQLIAPVQDALRGITQLYVVPHGGLHHLPFQALVNPLHSDLDPGKHIQRPRYLIEDYAIAYLPSASVLAFARQRKTGSTRMALIVGDPVYADPKYRRRPLDGALVEADTVAKYAEHALVLKREYAEEQVVKSVMGAMDLLHFATHGELNKEDPMQSRILLAAAEPDSINNGDLTVEKIFNLDLDAMLVTLSACQTAQLAAGHGSFTPGDDLVGLTRSFMYAGTPAVVASLWVVDDAATLEWMRHFYHAWLQNGMSRVQAARSAALRMLARPGEPDWIFPYFWAAFVYQGDVR
jgi:CHAT domain-containing protein/tetratricopeptide (TPR) repeat protein